MYIKRYLYNNDTYNNILNYRKTAERSKDITVHIMIQFRRYSIITKFYEIFLVLRINIK